MDYLSDKDGIVTLSHTGSMAPISFQHANSPRVLIMPMQVDWDKPLPGEAASEPPAAETPEEPAEAAPEEIEDDLEPGEVEDEPEPDKSAESPEPAPKKRRGKKRG